MQAQSPIPVRPENGKNGYNGSVPRSYIIEWDSFPGAIHYEYVLTDNSLCFAGCSGDTRSGNVINTYAVELNLVLNKWYYWIVRARMANGDVTSFTQIQSFYTAPRQEDARAYFTLFPTRVVENKINISAVWTIDPSVYSFNYKIISLLGENYKTSKDIELMKSELEQEEKFSIDLTGMQPGLYFIELKTNVSKIPERIKFLIVE